MEALMENYICGKHITKYAIVIEIYRTQWDVRLLAMTDCILLVRFHDVLSQHKTIPEVDWYYIEWIDRSLKLVVFSSQSWFRDSRKTIPRRKHTLMCFAIYRSKRQICFSKKRNSCRWVLLSVSMVIVLPSCITRNFVTKSNWVLHYMQLY